MATRVGILGATGAVGQRLVQLLDPHPEFEIRALTASEDSAGLAYRDAAKWRLDVPIPEDVADATVVETDPAVIPDDVDLLFSSLPSGVASEVEPALCEAGYVVSSNSSNARLDADVPLTIPELNPEHLELIEVQRDARGWDGALVKNPNCSTITFVPTVAQLTEFGLERVRVATLQAVSGAGYSGVSSMEILDNVLPHIGGEEEKMETESRKLLGEFDGAEVERHDVAVWVETADELDPETAREALAAAPSAPLPSSPNPFVTTFEEPDRPQPRLDRTVGDGMGIAVGPVGSTDGGVAYDCLAHNTLRGAAGASVLNGELLVREGWI